METRTSLAAACREGGRIARSFRFPAATSSPLSRPRSRPSAFPTALPA